jgi:pyridoxamine 5'-phosphate oxidase
MIPTPIAPATPEGALAMALAALAAAPADRASPLRTPTLATRGLDGAPMLRTVVLRGVTAASRLLHIHTDRRSAKAAEIAADPRVSLHGYDPAAQMQLRLSGHATLHAGDAIADAAWAACPEATRRSFAAAAMPGSALPAPAPMPGDGAAGRANFAALLLRFDRLDWLLLDPAGHARACFDWMEDGAMTATWIAP